jgi:hypothetical protein
LGFDLLSKYKFHRLAKSTWYCLVLRFLPDYFLKVVRVVAVLADFVENILIAAISFAQKKIC